MKKLVIAKMPVREKDAVVTMLFSDNRACEVYVDGTEEKTRAGDIYVGHTERVLEKSGGAFVRFKEGETGFLPANRMRNPVYCNAKKDDRIKAGDELIVRVETEKRSNKQAVLNTSLKGSEAFVSGIKEKGVHRPWGTCLYKAPKSWEHIYRRYEKEGFERIVTDIAEVYSELSDNEAAAFYDDPMVSLYRLYSMGSLLDELLQRKVWLPGGGYITIEQTEAFVAIDVNTAKTMQGKSAEEANLRVNIEAIRESARQIRCRGLSGTILIDLIPLKGKEKKEELLALFSELAGSDPVYTAAVDITELYIMEITRHKVKKSLREQIGDL